MVQLYKNLDHVYEGVREGRFVNESTFRQAFVEALKNEISSTCSSEASKRVLRVILDNIIRGRKPDVAFANVVMELEVPPKEEKPVTGTKIRKQLIPYMKKVAEPHLLVEVLGLATNGWKAELWRLRKIPLDGETDEHIDKLLEGTMPDVTRHLIRTLCSAKISILSPEDLITIFGV